MERQETLLDQGRETALAPASDKLVYIVDDEDTTLEMLAFIFKREGFRTRLFSNGALMLAGLREAQEGERADLIVMDLMMPQRGGYDSVRDLQAGGAGGIPVILMTGRAVDERMGEALRREPNVVEFMTKPIIPRLLAAAAHRILQTTISRPAA